MVDAQTYELVAQATLPVLYKIAMSMLRNDADARDAVQQALLRAWEKRAAPRPDAFRTYLTRILINECHNIQRNRMRVSPVPPEALPAPEGGEPTDYHALYRAIADLPDALRLPVLLRYMEGYSEKETARALGIPVTTLKSRLHRARKALRKTLDREVMFA